MELFIFTVSQKEIFTIHLHADASCISKCDNFAFCKNTLALESHIYNSPFLPLPFIEGCLGHTRSVHVRGPAASY